MDRGEQIYNDLDDKRRENEQARKNGLALALVTEDQPGHPPRQEEAIGPHQARRLENPRCVLRFLWATPLTMKVDAGRIGEQGTDIVDRADRVEEREGERKRGDPCSDHFG